MKLELGAVSTGPGEQVSVPVTLSATGQAGVGKIVFEVVFPAKLVSFVEATKGPAAESAQAEIKTQVRAREGNEGESILEVQVSASSAIPPGELLKLAVQVSKDAKLNDEINLKNVVQSIRSVEGQAVEAQGTDGVITVLSGPLFTCFFYMH